MPFYNVSVRQESWQIYDLQQEIQQQFRNIFDGYDIPNTPKPVFFPTEATYTTMTPPNQACYTLDLRVYYNPTSWGRIITADNNERWIRFKDCIMISVPTENLNNYDNSVIKITNAVVKLAGGLGFEDDGTTVLKGYDIDGVTQTDLQATIDTFLHMPTKVTVDGALTSTDGYMFNNVEYVFKPNIPVLFGKELITAGCVPEFAIERTFVNTVLVGSANVTLQSVNKLLNSDNFPNPAQAQECLSTALSGLRGNLTPEGAATFQATALVCLAKLQSDTEQALGDLIGLGFDPCKSKFELTPATQFTTRAIDVKISLNERNGTSITNGLSEAIAENISARIVPHISFGNITNFAYDGYQYFNASITSKTSGSGIITVSFDDQLFCTNTIPSNIDEPPTHTIQSLAYEFVYVPEATTGDGQPRRNESDLANDGRNGS
jgi:hypothetical protein